MKPVISFLLFVIVVVAVKYFAETGLSHYKEVKTVKEVAGVFDEMEKEAGIRSMKDGVMKSKALADVSSSMALAEIAALENKNKKRDYALSTFMGFYLANFKTRKGSNAGVKVTLRAHKMYEFIDRLINIALPRIKDFRGLSIKGIDSSCNYSFGIKEHIIFPEVNFDKVDKIRGLDITIVTSSKNKQGTLELLKEFNFPINDKKN